MHHKEELIKTVKAKRMFENVSSDSVFNTGGYKQEVAVINYCHSQLYIKNQGNIIYTVTPLSNKALTKHHSPHVEIRVTSGIIGSQDVKALNNLMHKMDREGVNYGNDARLQFDRLRNLVEAEPFVSRQNTVGMVRSFYVDESEILRAGYVYIQECDLLISFNEDVILEHHPQSNEAWSTADIRSKKEVQGAHGTVVRIVDNDNLRDAYYYHSAKRIIEVKPVRDTTKDSGVYFCELKCINGRTFLDETFMTFQEAEVELGLYCTQEEARTYGDPELLNRNDELRYKAELESNRRRIQELNVEIESMNQNFERQRLQFEAELSAAKHISTLRKEKIQEQAEVRKDHFDAKEKKRRDHFDKKEKKRKEKTEKITLTTKLIDAGIKAAPIAATLIGIGIAYFATKKDESTSKTLTSSVAAPTITHAMSKAIIEDIEGRSPYNRHDKNHIANRIREKGIDYDKLKKAFENDPVITSARRAIEKMKPPAVYRTVR